MALGTQGRWKVPRSWGEERGVGLFPEGPNGEWKPSPVAPELCGGPAQPEASPVLSVSVVQGAPVDRDLVLLQFSFKERGF